MPCLTDLPAELQNKILRELLVVRSPIRLTDNGKHFGLGLVWDEDGPRKTGQENLFRCNVWGPAETVHPAILRVSRWYKEAGTAILYKENVFNFFSIEIETAFWNRTKLYTHFVTFVELSTFDRKWMEYLRAGMFTAHFPNVDHVAFEGTYPCSGGPIHRALMSFSPHLCERRRILWLRDLEQTGL